LRLRREARQAFRRRHSTALIELAAKPRPIPLRGRPVQTLRSVPVAVNYRENQKSGSRWSQEAQPSQSPACVGCWVDFIRLLGAHRHTTVCRSLFRHPAADGSEIENRASVGPFRPHRPCHAFRFRWGIDCALAHGGLAPLRVKRAANSRMADSGSKKSS